jgi:hypothetical protein
MIVYQTYKNSDMTEGSGPMIPDLTFLYRMDADAYIDTRPGIMGRRAKWSTEKYSDWKVVPIEVLEHGIITDTQVERERLRESALSKLSDKEIEVLGINIK